MKIDNNTLIMIGLGVGAYFLLTRNKKNKKCPAGMEKKPVRGPQYGIRPSPEQEERDRLQWEKSYLNSPCISSQEAESLRQGWSREPVRA